MKKLALLFFFCPLIAHAQLIICDSVETLDLTKPTIHSVHSGAFIEYNEVQSHIVRSKRPDSYQRWLSFVMPFDTMLSFTITPLDGKTDFDFHLFHDDRDSFCTRFPTTGPMPLRSCLAQPLYDSITGLSWRATNSWEGAGPTVPYVRPISVKKDQHYYLLVQVSTDNPNPGIVKDNRFRISFFETGSAPHVTLRNVYFDNNKSVLKKESYKALDAMLADLKKKGNPKIVVVGHTDNAGNDSANLILSTARAKAVYDYFISKKYPAANISSEGRGSRFPIADNSVETGKALNRRVEIEFVP
jgi:outer membrane protein OmpA-like peptidoglycan-associated protein